MRGRVGRVVQLGVVARFLASPLWYAYISWFILIVFEFELCKPMC